MTDGTNTELSPSWSPDSSEIVYWASALPGSGGDRDVWVMNWDGTNKRMLPDLVIACMPTRERHIKKACTIIFHQYFIIQGAKAILPTALTFNELRFALTI